MNWRVGLIVLLIAIATAATMSRLTRADFTNWDDAHTISENPDFAPPTLISLRKIWTQPHADLYVPITYSTWWVLAKVSYATSTAGEVVQNPQVFHIANIVLHLLTSVVVFALLRRLFRNEFSSAIGAFLFALHPVQVEAVAWCAGLKDVLGGLLSAIALWQYVKYAQENSTRSYVISILVFCLAILAKPIAIVVPAMALVIELVLLKRGRAAIRGLAPIVIIAMAGAIEARIFQHAQSVTTLVSPIWRVPVAIDAIAFYLGKLIAPFAMTFDYGRHPKYVVESGAWMFTILLPILIAIILWIARRKSPATVTGALCFLVALLPMLGLARFDFQEFSTVADHYLYLPMIGVAIAVAGLLKPTRVGIAVSATVLALLAVRSFDQTKYWQDSAVLMRHATVVNQKSWVAYSNLASATRDRPDESLAFARKSLAIRDNPDAHINAGAILLEREQIFEATRHFEAALREQRSVEAHANLAYAYGKAERFEDAIRQYQFALQLSPGNKKVAGMLAKTQAYLRARRAAATQP